MRQEKTLKCIANFLATEAPLCELITYESGAEKAFVFSAMDFSEQDNVLEKFIARF